MKICPFVCKKTIYTHKFVSVSKIKNDDDEIVGKNSEFANLQNICEKCVKLISDFRAGLLIKF